MPTFPPAPPAPPTPPTPPAGQPTTQAQPQPMPQNENPQVPGDYYYRPLQENGPIARTLGDALGIVGKYTGQKMAKDAMKDIGSESGLPVELLAVPAAHVGGEIGSSVGRLMGQGIGYYLDNADALMQNAETALQQASDYRSWMQPSFM